MTENLPILVNETNGPLLALPEHSVTSLDVVHCGDALAVLKRLPSASVHCVVTSIPYFGLRDYGVEGQLGLEDTPRAFIERVVCVFREVRRVLRCDGTVWLNVGDSFSMDGKWGGHSGTDNKNSQRPVSQHLGQTRAKREWELKPKDLALIPHRIAIALQDDGWWVRMDIVWSKVNPMPASVQDRPTLAHEYIFLLTKAADYWYDQDSIREPHAASTGPRQLRGVSTAHKNVNGAPGQTPHSMNKPRPNHKNVQYDGQQPNGMHLKRANGEGDPDLHPLGRNKRSVWTIPTAPSTWEFCGACNRLYEGPGRSDIIKRTEIVAGEEIERKVCLCGRQDAWVQHFAAFPPDLIEPCILAGTPHKVCAECGAGYERDMVKERQPSRPGLSATSFADGTKEHFQATGRGGNAELKFRPITSGATVGWRKTCGCLTSATRPGTVLDPFFGSGTTGLVAKKWARHWLGIELNPDYVRVGQARCATPTTLPLFLEVN